ncbi:MAG: flagellar biosynthetic protein FliO [Anaeromyxobacter sp.]
MHALLAAALLSASPALPAPGDQAPPAPAAEAAALPEAAPAPAPAPAAPAPAAARPLELPTSAGPGLGSLIGPALVLLALAGAALFFSKRRRLPARMVQVLETTGIGPKRSLVVARMGDELLLLGSSESGITLLRSQPAPEAAAEPAPARPALQAAPAEPPAAVAGLVARLRTARRPAAAPAPAAAFDALLAESAEDQELRRKLARGQAGSVR